MGREHPTDYERDVLARLDQLLCARYGREGDALERGHRLSLLEAGYGTVGVWSALQAVLYSAETSFQTEQLKARLELMFRDLLTHPEDKASRDWANQYGYSSPCAASRAFRSHFEFDVGYVRRMGQVGRWLVAARREPRDIAGERRRDEAWSRIRIFRRQAGRKTLGPHAWEALNSLGTEMDAGPARRPRYPGVSSAETVWLKRSRAS